MGWIKGGDYHVDGCHPLVEGYLVLAREVVDVPDHARHDFPHPRRSFRTCGVDDALGEIGVESIGLRLVVGGLCVVAMIAVDANLSTVLFQLHILLQVCHIV